MPKRMQVLVEDAELRRMQREVRVRGLTLAEWVRTTLREALRVRPPGRSEAKRAAVRVAACNDFPVADIDTMLEEIERGYGTAP